MVKNLPANTGDLCLSHGSKRSPGEGNGYPRQYSCLENSTDRRAWWARVHRVAESDMWQYCVASLRTMMDSVISLVPSEHVGVRLLPRQCSDKKGGQGIPWWSSGQDSALPMQGAWV